MSVTNTIDGSQLKMNRRSQGSGDRRRTREAFLSGRPKPLIPNAQFGMILFVITELMFFAALVSAYLVIKATSIANWAPPASALLPETVSLANTVVLMFSGALMFVAARWHQQHELKVQSQTQSIDSPDHAQDASAQDAKVVFCFAQAILLGLVFVGVQGYEWIELFRQGMSMTSGIFGACFYLLVGSHALHAFAGAMGMLWCLRKLLRGELDANGMWSMQIFWTLVVLVWPVLYGLIYLH